LKEQSPGYIRWPVLTRPPLAAFEMTPEDPEKSFCLPNRAMIVLTPIRCPQNSASVLGFCIATRIESMYFGKTFIASSANVCVQVSIGTNDLHSEHRVNYCR
ncbi:MAG: hypothetical protein WB680_16770, partial [Candidatus Acidiferrales bacterium]